MINLIIKKRIKYLRREHYNYVVKLCTIEYKKTNKSSSLIEYIGHEATPSLFIKKDCVCLFHWVFTNLYCSFCNCLLNALYTAQTDKDIRTTHLEYLRGNKQKKTFFSCVILKMSCQLLFIMLSPFLRHLRAIHLSETIWIWGRKTWKQEPYKREKKNWVENYFLEKKLK